MASFNYMNNSAPFWDFIASLEQQGNSHPFFNQDRQNRGTESEHGEAHGIPPPNFDPFSWGQQFFGGPGGLPHRGPPGPPPPPGPHGPPPPPGPHGAPPHRDHHHHHHDEDHKHGEKHDSDSNKDNDNDNDNDNGEGPSGSGSDSEGGRHCGRRGRCGGRRGRHGFGGRGGRGGFGPHHGGPGHHGPHGHGPHSHHHGGPWGRGPWGPRGRGHPWADRGAQSQAPFDPSSFLAPLFAAFTAQHPSNNPPSTDLVPTDTDDHVPDADIFDTPSAYVIHLSLPGARKEDVGVNWDAERSELCVAGVIYRPGDEELLKTLAMGERKVGAFERKIRLGSRANPARVDAEGITAKLEDGVLRVEVRKEEEGFVEVRKVDVE